MHQQFLRRRFGIDYPSLPQVKLFKYNYKFKGIVERSIISSAVFLLFSENRPWRPDLCMLVFIEMSKKDTNNAKERRQFRGVLGRWRTTAIDSTTFYDCQRCRKTAVLAVISRLLGLTWRVEALNDQQCQFLTRNKSLSNENNSNSRTTCVRAYRFGFASGRCPT